MSDRVKLYKREHLDPDSSAVTLQQKVQFDIRLHFARRGCENMEKMQKDHFKLQFDKKQELWYLIKAKDELTKNHKEIGEIISGIMPENPTDRLCLIRSYRIYMEHLNLQNKFLWQTPLQNANMEKQMIWYGLQHLGKNTLGSFMTDLSTHCKLSQKYTNHSICVTGLTVLTRMQFSTSEIMSVLGHKSVQSLTNYQKTNQQQNISMGKVLYQSMTRAEEEINVPERKKLPSAECPAIDYDVNRKHQIVPSERAIAPSQFKATKMSAMILCHLNLVLMTTYLILT